MKKIMKTLIICLFIILAVFVVSSQIFAATIPTSPPTDGDEITKISSIAKSGWKTFAVIAQVLSMAAIVFAGIKYMFAAPEEKADIKKGLVILVLGAVLVFSAGTVAIFIDSAAVDILT